MNTVADSGQHRIKVVFRVDASQDIGSGHVMRCLSLAVSLREAGIRPHFVCRELPGNLISRIRAREFAVTTLPLREPYRPPTCSDDYAGWSQVSEQDDAAEFLAAVPDDCAAAVVDHYGLGLRWESAVLERVGKLVAIDDLCRSHKATFVIDQTLGRTADAYHASKPAEILAGSKFALLQPMYYQAREQLDRSIPPTRHRLLVSPGGFDLPNLTGAVLEVLAGSSFSWLESVDVVLPSAAPHFAKISQRISELDERFVLHDFVENFAELISRSTLAVGAPGTTTWERAVLGLPSVLVPIAENQAGNAASMRAANAAIVLDIQTVAKELCGALEALREHWSEYVRASLCVTAGLGSRLSVQRIWPRLARSGEPVWLQPAGQADIRQVFAWQQHEETRRYARNPAPPQWADHESWMNARLADPGCHFYMLQLAGNPVGFVRLDRLKPCEYEVSVAIAPDCYGQGLGSLALALLSDLHREVTIHATVLRGNAASLRLFSAAGYMAVSETEFVLPGRE